MSKALFFHPFDLRPELTSRSFLYLIDGGMGLSFLPLAAFLTGMLLTIGIAVLLVVVIAIRKRRETTAQNICDDKDKHLGKYTFPEWRVIPNGI